MQSATGPAGTAPARFVEWIRTSQIVSKTDNRTYNYHPRSNTHSIALCRLIAEDIFGLSEELRNAAGSGRLAYGVNVDHTWSNGKKKNLDLAIGIPEDGASLSLGGIAAVQAFSRVFLSCEAKNTMTEHKKSQPRIFDELSSSHEIVHQGDPHCLAAGIAVINICSSFISPTRQRLGTPVEVTKHRQPDVTNSMVQHLRGLPIRENGGQVGFDAFATVIVDCDNQGSARLHITSPAPVPGARDSYDTFLERIVEGLELRLKDLQ